MSSDILVHGTQLGNEILTDLIAYLHIKKADLKVDSILTLLTTMVRSH